MNIVILIVKSEKLTIDYSVFLLWVKIDLLIVQIEMRYVVSGKRSVAYSIDIYILKHPFFFFFKELGG